MKRKIVSVGILLTALALTGCAKKNKVTESTTEVVASQTAAITVAEVMVIMCSSQHSHRCSRNLLV